MSEKQLIELDDVAIESILKPKSTKINIYVDQSVICLANLRTSSLLCLKCKILSKYIVAYVIDERDNKKVTRVVGFFDRTNKKIIQVTKENRKMLKYMTIRKKMFELTTVLEYLNYGKISAAFEEEVAEFEMYMTAGNSNIAREEIEKEIFAIYPGLKKYTGYEREIRLDEYKEILADIGTDKLYFNIISKNLL